MRNIALLIFIFLHSPCLAQQDSTATGWASRIFLPSLDVGYLVPNSDLLEGSLKITTSVEYRIRNNNDFFIRLTYDTYSARYRLSDSNNTTNTIEGTVQFQDLFLSPGYRFGDKDFRLMLTFMPGLKFYEFPTASQNGSQIIISQRSEMIFTTSFLASFELYFDQKSAFTLSLFQNQVWRDVDFWADGRAAYGISLGFITSLL